MSCIVYIACRMSNRDKTEQVDRAEHVCGVLRLFNLTPISPVLIEGIKRDSGALLNDNKNRLKSFWVRDKYIIRNMAHVVIIDGADEKSFGVEREMAYARWCIWKPCLLVMPKQRGYTVADLEDDCVTESIEQAAELIRKNWGTWFKRFIWRLKMLNRSLPKWVIGQILAFR